jgi:hypothetical protein
MTERDAYEMIDRLINELQVTRGANKKRAIEIKINPGFKTRQEQYIHLFQKNLFIRNNKKFLNHILVHMIQLLNRYLPNI